MKKILFASTALVATAGMAAAEVNFSGLGRFGIQYIENNFTGGDFDPTTGNFDPLVEADDTFLESRFRLNIDGNAETDGGVAFSARVRLQADDNADGSAGTAGLNGARFTTQYEGFRVDVGNIAGVIDNLPGYYGYEPGLTLFTGQYVGADFAFDGYTSTGAGENGVFAQYAFGDFAVSGSYSGDTAGSEYGISDGTEYFQTGDSQQYGISAQWSNDNYNVALGYARSKYESGTAQTIGTTTVRALPNGEADMVVLTAGATFGAFTGTLLLGRESADFDPDNVFFDNFYGLSATYDVGAATTIGFAYGDGSATLDTQGYGIGVIHDLGGGVSLRGGIGSSKVGDGDRSTAADLGVQFNF